MGDGKPWELGPQTRQGCALAFLAMAGVVTALGAFGAHLLLHG